MARRPGRGFQFEALELGVETCPGVDLFVDTVRGSTGKTGLSWDKALSTVEGALDRLDTPKFFSAEFARNARIWVIGDIREQFTAPLGVYGTKIIGAAHGRARHSTSGGTVVDGNGCSWRESATAENKPLIALREQGFEIHNIVMIPEDGYPAVQLRCAEDATDPDASHFIARGVRFISGGSQVGYGIEQIGGSAQLGIYGCWFTNLEYAYKPTSYAIRNDQDHEWFDNRFSGNKHDVAMNATRCEFRRNRFMTVYHATTHPTTLNLANSGGDGSNRVVDNEFSDNAADVTIAKGYKPGTADVWRNRVANTAADIVTVPA